MGENELYQFKNLVLSDKYINEPSKLAAVIGVDDNGEPILFDFAKYPHLFVGGDQGCGKSTLIHSIIMSLMRRNTPEEFQFVYFEPKGFDVNLYKDSKYLYFNNNNIIAAFEFLLQECRNRSNILWDNRKKTVSDYNKYAESFDDLSLIPELFVIIDEVSYFKYQEKEKLQIEELMKIGRTVGVHLIIADTNPTLSYVFKIAQIMPYKVVFRFTKADYKALLERNNIVPLSDDGEIICDFRGVAYIHGHSCFVTEDEITQEVSKNIIKRNEVSKSASKKKEESKDNISESGILSNSAFEVDTDLLNKNIPFDALRNKETVDARDYPDLAEMLKELGIVDIDKVTEKQIIVVSKTEHKAKLLGVSEELAKCYGNVTLTVYPESKAEKEPEQDNVIKNEENGIEKEKRFSERIFYFLKRFFGNRRTVLLSTVVFVTVIIMLYILNQEKFSFKAFAIDFIVFCFALGGLAGHGKKVFSKKSKYNIYAIDNISDGHTFEYVVADLLKGVGFSNVKVTVGSGDYGIDVLANYDGCSYAIQCKKYSSKVGISAVQEAYAGRSYYGCNYAMVITNNYFTPAAIKLAKSTGVILWDRNNVKKLINGHI